MSRVKRVAKKIPGIPNLYRRYFGPNPAYGAHLPAFSGIPTFMRQPATRNFKGVDVAIVGVPFDSGTSYRSGTRFGPRKIREASMGLDDYNTVLGVAPVEVLSMVDYGDVEVVPVDIESNMQAITSEVSTVLKQGVQVISLGGDHSIALPLLRAHAAKFGPVAVLQFDSHTDTWASEFGGHRFSHATPFRRAIEEGFIDTEAYIQVGIRGSVSSASNYGEARCLGADILTIDEAFEMGMPAVIAMIHEKVGERSMYVSLDIDAVDPAYAPGTGTPEVGGFTSYQMLQMVRGLRGLNIVGFDLVEVSPPYDLADITAILAANLVFEFLSLIAVKRHK